MPTITTGTMFLSKTRPAVEASVDDRPFSVTLVVLDRQGPKAVEPYRITWRGPDAAAWWRRHGDIQPGQPLRIELVNPRSFPAMRGSETQATVRALSLAPHASECRENP
jgi:hypothetical protein